MKKVKLKDLGILMGSLSPDSKKRIAAKAKTSVATLRQYTTGVRNVSAEKAALIEKASGGAIRRETLCKACGACELAKAGRTVLKHTT